MAVVDRALREVVVLVGVPLFKVSSDPGRHATSARGEDKLTASQRGSPGWTPEEVGW